MDSARFLEMILISTKCTEILLVEVTIWVFNSIMFSSLCLLFFPFSFSTHKDFHSHTTSRRDSVNTSVTSIEYRKLTSGRTLVPEVRTGEVRRGWRVRKKSLRTFVSKDCDCFGVTKVDIPAEYPPYGQQQTRRLRKSQDVLLLTEGSDGPEGERMTDEVPERSHGSRGGQVKGIPWVEP